MCPETQILGVDRNGVFAEYVAVPESVIWQNDRTKLPAEIATLQEPFGNAVLATLSHDLAGQTVGVFGCGPIGLFSIGIAKASGASPVFAIDPVGEGIGHDIEIRCDVYPVEFSIVAGIHDRDNLLGRGRPHETAQKASGADSAAESHDWSVGAHRG